MSIFDRFFRTEPKKTGGSSGAGSDRILVVANWKCHKTADEACRWLDSFASGYHSHAGLEVVIAPTLLALERVARHLEELQLPGVALASQDVSPFPRGGYTGAVVADMLKGLVHYVIVGHSERRRYFHETVMDVTNKVTEVLDAGLHPIICVDRSYAAEQLSALADLETGGAIVAYCPVDALSFRIPESPELVAVAAQEIGNVFPGRAVIYGGSLTAENVGEYLASEPLAGVFIGSASLDPEQFLSICHRAAEACGPA